MTDIKPQIYRLNVYYGDPEDSSSSIMEAHNHSTLPTRRQVKDVFTRLCFAWYGSFNDVERKIDAVLEGDSVQVSPDVFMLLERRGKTKAEFLAEVKAVSKEYHAGLGGNNTDAKYELDRLYAQKDEFGVTEDRFRWVVVDGANEVRPQSKHKSA